MAEKELESNGTKVPSHVAATSMSRSESPSSLENGSDDQALDRFGYKSELKRRFGFWSTMGLSCTIMVTWEGWFTTAAVGLTDGGLAGCVWGFLICWVGYTAVIASLAELISMIPTAGGQYHWTYELAPARWRKFISWITGWQIVCAWQADLAAIFYLVGTIIQGLAVLNWPDYAAQRWQGTLIMWALIVVAIIFNTLVVKMLPFLENCVLVVHCAGFLLVLVPLLHFGPHASAHDVFTQVTSLGGYSTGTAFFVGLITTVFAFIGADGAIHMCEEVQNARTTVPNALMASAMVNGALGFGMVIGVMFTIGDVSDAVVTKTGFVFIDYFARALGSDAFATGLTSLFIVLFTFTTVAVMASASRVTWAFARDNGLPGSSWLKTVSPTFQLPLMSIFLTSIISVLLSLINIGSAVAFNAIVSLVVAAFFGSYTVPIAIIAWRRAAGHPLQYGPWKLGRFGLVTNIVALIFLVVAFIFSFFPIAVPVTGATMNWSCVIWGAVMFLGTFWYFIRQRHVFTGPKVVMGHLDLT